MLRLAFPFSQNSDEQPKVVSTPSIALEDLRSLVTSAVSEDLRSLVTSAVREVVGSTSSQRPSASAAVPQFQRAGFLAQWHLNDEWQSKVQTALDAIYNDNLEEATKPSRTLRMESKNARLCSSWATSK